MKRQNKTMKDACKRDMKEDNATKRAEWRKKLYPQPQMTGRARDEEEAKYIKVPKSHSSVI